jgi:hypothetical protein
MDTILTPVYNTLAKYMNNLLSYVNSIKTIQIRTFKHSFKFDFIINLQTQY